MPGFKQAFVQPIDQASNLQLDDLNDIQWRGNKAYKYIQYSKGTGSVAGVLGQVVDHVGLRVDGIVTSDYSDTPRIGAGVLLINMDDLDYGWIQIKGEITVSCALAGLDGSGQTLIAATDGKLLVPTAIKDFVCAIRVSALTLDIACAFPF